jgi:acylphosphatase
MERIHLIISGDVIGVGFRAWVLRQARSKRLTGWVKNRDDNCVEIIAEGLKTMLQEFIIDCQKGPEVANVDNVMITWDTASGEFDNFSVVY